MPRGRRTTGPGPPRDPRRSALRGCRSRLAALPVLLGVAGGAPLAAHVALDAPNGGEILVVGEQVLVEWHVVVEHSLENWDLWYSTHGEQGPWIPIATDLPAGDGSTGAAHSYEWTVPDDPSQQVRVRVRQDNIGTDYYDASDGDLAIRGTIFADGFESGDTTAWSPGP